jgi:putative radical SAM enzyme (TIGR03279 family)
MNERTVGVRVESVAAGSIAARAGIAPGDRIVSVSGEPVFDLLDLHFHTSRSRFRLRWATPAGVAAEKEFRTGGAGLGIFPEPIRVKRCRNRCIFCFVHQLPRGLRRNLYVKDEDVRLSFLHGQYVTFSDISGEELRKILAYRLSPLYVSIHTTDAELRRRMLGNPEIADIMSVMRRLVDEGIVLHGQIVVCPGINDGEELQRTIRSLMPLRPGLATVAVVPVGLTAHREGLPPLRPVSRKEAVDTLDLLDKIRRTAGRTGGEPFAVAADEYYLIAKKEIPGRKSYGSFAQIGNGVGLLRRFEDDAKAIFRRKRWKPAGAGGAVVTGYSPRGYVKPFLAEFSRRAGARFEAVAVENRLMGRSVNVTGLLGGRDILRALRQRGKIRRVYLPSVTLRDAGDLFLDNLSPDDLARETGAEVRVFDPTPRGFFDAVYKTETSII